MIERSGVSFFTRAMITRSIATATTVTVRMATSTARRSGIPDAVSQALPRPASIANSPWAILMTWRTV